MPPNLVARTVDDDPGFMLLYYCLQSMTEKPDFEQVADRMGLTSATAASKRLRRLLKVQGAAEKDMVVENPPSRTRTTPTPSPSPVQGGGGAGSGAGRRWGSKGDGNKRVKHAVGDGGEVVGGVGGAAAASVGVDSRSKKRRLVKVEDAEE